MSLRAGVAAVLGMALCAALCAAEPSLTAYYALDEGAGAVAMDKSGKGNNGRIVGDAKWAKGDFGTALDFDGTGVYVDCGQAQSLNIGSTGTVSVWCCPRSLQGGIVNWSTGGGWDDERLVLAFNTYSGGHDLFGCLGAPKVFQQLHGFGELKPKAWVHLALAFDGKSVQIYRDGLLCNSVTQDVTPEIKGVPLWIGRCQGLGKGYFDGLIGEVRVYNGSLSAEEVFALYKQEAARRGEDVACFTRPRIEAAAYPGPGRIVASVDVRAMQPLPPGMTLSAELCSLGSSTPIQREQFAPTNLARVTDVLFDAQALAPGEYQVRCALLNPDQKLIGTAAEAKVAWPGQPPEFKGVNVLNNLVWELLNAKAEPERDIGPALAFNNPCDRWIFIRATAEVGKGGKLAVFVDSQDAPAIVCTDGSEPALEAMRYLPAGPHTLNIKAEGGARLQQIVVRSIPMLQYAFYGADPHIAAYGPYDWAFLKKDVLPNVNTMISGGDAEPPELKDWKKSGRKWITITAIPAFKGTDEAAVDTVYQSWAGTAGFSNPLMDGVIVDEFGGGNEPIYDVFRKAVERLCANPQFKGKMYIPYGGCFYAPDRSREFARVAIEGGGYVAWECYLPEASNESAARAAIRSVADNMRLWEKGLPGVTRRMCIVYGCMCQPTESLNVNPLTDYRVFADMQIQELATNPVYFGLGGIQEYHSSYCDEENLRLIGRLFRHYAIEGNTTPLITDPYALTHIQNPDFEKGATGWTVSPAENGSIEPRDQKGLSWLEGRYPPTAMGNTFLWMKRSAAGPNAFSQEIGDLTPGRLYSVKMITADYQDLIQQKSNKSADAVTIRLDDVEVLPGPKNSFQFTFPSNYGHTQGKFNREYPFWMNYHWRVFRAKAATARLTVSDWASDKEPGGPIGQELTFNFIEIEPYIGE